MYVYYHVVEKQNRGAMGVHSVNWWNKNCMAKVQLLVKSTITFIIVPCLNGSQAHSRWVSYYSHWSSRKPHFIL